jgi:hypothetical protein
MRLVLLRAGDSVRLKQRKRDLAHSLRAEVAISEYRWPMNLCVRRWSPWLLASILSVAGGSRADDRHAKDLMRPACGVPRVFAETARKELRLHEDALAYKPKDPDELRSQLPGLKQEVARREAEYQSCVDKTPPAMSEEDARKKAQANEMTEQERALEQASKPKTGAIAPRRRPRKAKTD